MAVAKRTTIGNYDISRGIGPFAAYAKERTTYTTHFSDGSFGISSGIVYYIRHDGQIDIAEMTLPRASIPDDLIPALRRFDRRLAERVIQYYNLKP